MEEVLKYSALIGPYFFIIFVVFTVAVAVWLISELRKNSMAKHAWFVKRNGDNFKKIVIH
jgi:hypothetical protein